MGNGYVLGVLRHPEQQFVDREIIDSIRPVKTLAPLHQLRQSAGGFVFGDQIYEPLPGVGYRSLACE